MAMVRVQVVVPPGGMHPLQACKAWLLREEGHSWPETQQAVCTVDGTKPKMHALRNAVARVDAQRGEDVPGQSQYHRCGRKAALGEDHIKEAVKFVRAWRHKRFCTCRYIIQELKLPCSSRTLARILNANGYFWKAVSKRMRLSQTISQFKQRVAQILNGFSVAKEGEPCSFLQKLVRGMPKRLAKCKRQRYGRCGK